MLGQTWQTGQTGRTKLTFKLDFPCSAMFGAAFTILAMFSTST